MSDNTPSTLGKPPAKENLCKHGGVSAQRTCYDGKNTVLSYSRYINNIRYTTCWKCEWLCQGCRDRMAPAGWCSACRASLHHFSYNDIV